MNIPKSVAAGSLFLVLLFSFSGCKAEEKLAPKFPRDGVWLQTDSRMTNQVFQNHLTLLYFWDYTSVNCLRDMTYLKKWDALYKPYGLQIILVHSPEFEFAYEKENVLRALKLYNIPYPVLLDNKFSLWEAYKNYSWPTKTLIDRNGKVILSQAGEGKYLDFEKAMRNQLAQMDSRIKLPAALVDEEPEGFDDETCGPMPGETYVGSKRSHWWGGEIANRSWTKPKTTSVFKDRGERVQRGFFLQGLWTNHEDDFQHARDTSELSDYLGIIYYGSSVYSVMRLVDSNESDARVYVTRDGQPVPEEFRGKDLKVDEKGQTYVPLKEARLYHLILNEDESQHEVKLWTKNQGVAVSSFSFANRCLGSIDFLKN